MGAEHDTRVPAKAEDAALRQGSGLTGTHSSTLGLSGVDVLALQRAFGNAAVSQLLARPDAPSAPWDPSAIGGLRQRQLQMRPPVVQRDPPNASMPPPNQSTAPASPGFMNNGITYQGELILPDVGKCKAVLKKLLPEKGFHGASSYGKSFADASSDERAKWVLFADADYQKRCQDAMRSAVTEFDEECRVFMEKFETTAGNVTDAMLINATDKIHEEQKKLGLDSTVNVDRDPGMPGTVSTTYNATNKGYLAETKVAAGQLAEKRSLADMRKGKADTARKQAEGVRAALPAGVTALTPGPGPAAPSPVAPGVTIAPSASMTEEQSTRASWKEAEDDFRNSAKQATDKYAALGPLVMGGEDTTEKLRAYSKQSDKEASQNLGEQFSEKLANIETVRGELGKRFSIWTQPIIVSIVHQKMASGPGEQRMVADKVKLDQQAMADTKKMYAAIALGVGLLAAIPTGGAGAPAATFLAGVALTAAVGSAALSAYTAFEESKEYLLQSAAANTSLDRANQISDADPSLLFLAIDIAAAITDLGAAKAAFTTLKEIYLAAKAAKSLEKLPELAVAMKRAAISPGNQGRILSEVLPAGGDMDQALKQIRKAIVSATENAADQGLADIMRIVSERAINNKKVIVIPANKNEAYKVLKQRLQGMNVDADKKTAEVIGDFFVTGANPPNGMYYQDAACVVILGNESADVAASVLIHELTHRGQDMKKIMGSMGVYRSEYEAFLAQQQFLRMLPPDRVAALRPEYQLLLGWTPKQIEDHVLTAYVKYGAFKPAGLDNASLADNMYGRIFSARGGM